MKVSYKPSPTVVIEIEGGNLKEIFQQQAVADEVFKVTTCGDTSCKSTDLSHVVREKDGNKFYELRCNKCFKKLSFGQSRDQRTIFPRKTYHDQHPDVKAGKAKTGDRLPNGGWEYFGKAVTEDEG